MAQMGNMCSAEKKRGMAPAGAKPPAGKPKETMLAFCEGLAETVFKLVGIIILALGIFMLFRSVTGR